MDSNRKREVRARCQDLLWRLEREPMSLQILKKQVIELIKIVETVATD